MKYARPSRKTRKTAIRRMARYQGVTIAQHKMILAGKPEGMRALLDAVLNELSVKA